MIPKRLSLLISLKLRLLNILNHTLKTFRTESYSQFGEDIALLSLMKYKLNITNGTYVDVGCNHPRKFSNSFLLYLNGWKGVTIDLNKKLMKLHQNERKLDIQFQSAISNVSRKTRIYEHSTDLMTTIEPKFHEQYKEGYLNDLKENEFIETVTLNQILQNSKIKKIDLLCIDVEGHDYNVLQSISLEVYQPKIILIEMHDCNLENIFENEIYIYLLNQGYRLEGYLFWNGYFVRKELSE